MSLAGDFFLWWAARMSELVPQRLRRREKDLADALLMAVSANAASVELTLRQRGRETSLGPLSLEGKPAVALGVLLGGHRPPATLLHLPATMLLEREIALPLATEADIDRVLAYEMDRFTPFAAADVYWVQRVLRTDRAQGRLWVRLSLVPKAAVARLMGLLDAAGLAPGGLRVPAADGKIRRIGLVAPESRRERRARRLQLAAVAACVLLAVMAAGLPILMQIYALAGIDAETARLRPAMAEVESLRRATAIRAGSGDVLAAEAALLGSALGVIATLTDVLPDDTYLTALTLRQRQITLNGQSANAAQLIPRLSAAPALQQVAFLSPVTRAEPSRAEIFAIGLAFGR